MQSSHKILNMYFATHKTCNLSCSYCYIPFYNRQERKVNDADIIISLRNFIDKAESEGFAIGKFCLHGSEPSLMEPETLADCVTLVNEHWQKKSIKGLSVAIQTNGLRITNNYLDILESRLDNKNLLRIGFSIDPPKQVHDLLRNNSYDSVFNNMINTILRGFPVGILSVLSSETMKYLEEFCDWMKYFLNVSQKEGNPYKIKIKFASGELSLSEEEMGKFSYFLLENDLLGLCQILTPGYCMQRGNECEWYEFDIEGNCYSCNKAYGADGIFANWRNESFLEIVDKRKNLYITSLQHPDCRECIYELICNGGCPLDRHKKGELKGKALECSLLKVALGESEKKGKYIYGIIDNIY
jgi:radical SAM protein with 4Fe4S-binding SPASM domain